jgi:hypothetical protein
LVDVCLMPLRCGDNQDKDLEKLSLAIISTLNWSLETNWSKAVRHFWQRRGGPEFDGPARFRHRQGYRYDEFAGFCVPMEEAEARLGEALGVFFKASMTATPAASP